MNKELRDRLMWISITGLFIASIIFIVVFILSDFKENTLLFAAIFCNVLAGLFNVVRGFTEK